MRLLVFLFFLFSFSLCYSQRTEVQVKLVGEMAKHYFAYTTGKIHEKEETPVTMLFYHEGKDTLNILDVWNDSVSLTKNFYHNSLKLVKFPAIVYPNDTFRVDLLLRPVGLSGDFYRRIHFSVDKVGLTQNWLITGIVIPAAAANLKFSETFHDFGLMKRGDTINYKIKYKNTGPETIKILSPHNAQYFSALVLLPGDSGYLTVSGETCQMDKFWERTFYFSTDKTGKYAYLIKTTGRFHPFEQLLRFEEDSLVGTWTRDPEITSASHEFIFKNVSNKTVYIDRVTTGDGGTMAWPEKKEPVKPGEKSKIIMHFNLDSSRPGFNRALVISYRTAEADENGCNIYPAKIIIVKIKIVEKEKE
jgi:hypothetical protein